MGTELVTAPLTIFAPEGEHVDPKARDQIRTCLQDPDAVRGALMADHHLGYSMPIGGVVAYADAISPTGVGFDIACGNMAVKTSVEFHDILNQDAPDGMIDSETTAAECVAAVKPIMREIQKRVEFGVGRSNADPIDHPLFDNPVWEDIGEAFGPGLEEKARAQLGTVGSGNHYVDLFVDEDSKVWIANHFGSRGLGHTIASGFMAAAQGLPFTERVKETDDPIMLRFGSEKSLADFYVAAMQLAGEYAYAGREYVTDQVLRVLGGEAVHKVHNHHNYAWKSKADGYWYIGKGATPLTSEPAFIGGSMGDMSVIVRGRNLPDDFPGQYGHLTENIMDIGALGFAPHGAGRVMSRTKAAGKFKKIRTESGKRIRVRDKSTAAINWDDARQTLLDRGITVLGAGADESPGVYKDLAKVLAAHENIVIDTVLRPIGVVMAGEDTYDPYKD